MLARTRTQQRAADFRLRSSGVATNIPGQCYFQVAWLEKPEFRVWVGKIAGDYTLAYCRVCKKGISVSGKTCHSLLVKSNALRHTAKQKKIDRQELAKEIEEKTKSLSAIP